MTRNRLPRLSAAVMAALTAACVEAAPDLPTEGDLKVIKENILSTAPTPKFKVNADLEGKVVYLGLDTDKSELRPGESVVLTHYWKVVKAPGEGWRLFVHLQDQQKKGYVNVDHVPVQGKYKVEQWKAGEIIRDKQTVS